MNSINFYGTQTLSLNIKAIERQNKKEEKKIPYRTETAIIKTRNFFAIWGYGGRIIFKHKGLKGLLSAFIRIRQKFNKVNLENILNMLYKAKEDKQLQLKELLSKLSIILHLQREHTELNTSQLEISTYSKLLSLHP